jgi:hypothetical protein
MSGLLTNHLRARALYFDAIADTLNDLRQNRVCSYGAHEVGATDVEGKLLPFRCDCKYGGPTTRPATEANGCPELRDMVNEYRQAARACRETADPTPSTRTPEEENDG